MDVNGDLNIIGKASITAGEYFYYRGDANTDGSVRISSQTAGVLLIEQRTAGVWAEIPSGGGVGTTGSPSNTYVAVFADANTITGTTNLVFTATSLDVAKKVSVTELDTYNFRLANSGAGGGYWNIGQTYNGFTVGGGKLLFIPDSESSANAAVTLVNATGNMLIGTTDDDGTPSTGRLVVKASTNNGTTNALVVRDSLEVNVLTINSDGNIDTAGSLQFSAGQAVDTIETTLTDDDTHLPTSGAVFGAIADLLEDIVTVTTGTTLDDTAFGNAYSLQGSGSYTVALPAATVANTGQRITLYKEGNSATSQLITVNTDGTQVINTSGKEFSSLQFRFTGELVSLISHGDHWDVRGSSSVFTTSLSAVDETSFINGILKLNWLSGGVLTLLDVITLTGSHTINMTGIRIFGDSGEGTRIAFPNESYVLTVTGAGFYFDSVRFKGIRTARNTGTSQHILTLVSDGVNAGKFENCVFRDICTSNINNTNGNISLSRTSTGAGYNISFTDCDIFTGGSGGADGLHFVNIASNNEMSFMNIFAVLHKRVTDNFNLFRLTGSTFSGGNANSYSDGSVIFDTGATGNVLMNPAILTGAPLVTLQTAKTTPASDDLLLLSSTTDSGALRKTTVSELAAVFGAGTYVTAPTTPTSTGVQGQRAYSDNYVYECVATDTWVRYAAESTWS